MLIDSFSFALRPGDRAALIGEEGNGKSTLLRAIADPGSLAGYAEVTGEILTRGERIGYLRQEPAQAEREQTVRALLSGPEALRAAARFGLSPAFCRQDRTLATLSGGEQVKLRLCRLIADEPTVLLLDEPSNDLDIDALEALESFLNGCGLPAIYVSHDETLLEATANAVIHLELVQKKNLPRWTAARLPYREYIERRTQGLARQTRLAGEERRAYDEQQERVRRLAQNVDNAMHSVSRADPHAGKMLKRKMGAVKAAQRRLDAKEAGLTRRPDTEEAIGLRFGDAALPAGKAVLDLRLDALEAGGKRLCGPVRLFVAGGEHVCITGANGAGKTTLLRRISAELLPRADLNVGVMPQDYAEALDLSRTPVQLLNRSGSRQEATAVRQYLGSARFTPQEMDARAGELSGGQKAKLLLLRLILDGCDVLLLDEPTRNLSPLSGPALRDALRAYRGTIIGVSHDRKFISEVCDRALRLTPDGLAEV